MNKVPCKAWRPVGSAFFDLLGAAEQTLVGLMDTPRFNIKKRPGMSFHSIPILNDKPFDPSAKAPMLCNHPFPAASENFKTIPER